MKASHKLILNSFVFSSLITLPYNIAWAKAEGKSDENTLKQKIEALEEKQKILEQNWEIDKAKAETKEKEESKEAVKAGVNSKEGFYLKSKDGNYALRLKGLVQIDARFFLKDKSNNNDQFLARSIRPIFEGDLTKYFSFRIAPDFGQGTTILQDAYADIKPLKEIKLRAGKFKVPLSLERLQNETNLVSIERGLASSLAPNRDIGFMLHGDIANSTVQYAVGAFNGGSDASIVDGDNSDGKELAARLFFHPFKLTSITTLEKFGFGISTTLGKQTGSASSTGLSSYKSIGQNTFFNYRSTGTLATTTIANGKRWRLSPQGYFYYGPFGLFGEYVLSSQKVTLGASNTTLKNSAWQIAASYVLTGEENSFLGLKVKKPVNFKKGNYGAIELGARYNELDIDDKAFPVYADASVSATKAKTWGIVANWYLTDNFKWSVSFDQTRFKGGASSGDRPTENALFTRLQIAY